MLTIAVAVGLSSLVVFDAAALRSMGLGGIITVVSTLVFGLTVLVIGVGLPAAVIAAVNDRSSVKQQGIELTDAENQGRDLFAARCTQCHTLAASNANATVGPDLDTLKPPKGLILDAIANGRARGNGQMPAQLYTGQEAQDVAAYVAKVAGAGA